MGNTIEHVGKASEPLKQKPKPPDLNEWDPVVLYLPRIKSYKRRRSNSLPLKQKPPMRILPLADVNSRRRSWRRSDYFYPEMIPEPDYSDSNEEEEEAEEDTSSEPLEEENLAVEEITAKEDTKTMPTLTPRLTPNSEDSFGNLRRTKTAPMGRNKSIMNGKEPPFSKLSTDGLVIPKKPCNPYLESEDRQKLCKELKFSQKYGKGGFNPKSELQKALERFQEDKLRKSQAINRKSSLDKILEQQAKKIEMQEKEGRSRRPDWIDRLQEQPDSWIENSKTDEFFRVHARVMAHQSGGSSGSSSDSLVDEDEGSKSTVSFKTSSKSSSVDDEDQKDTDEPQADDQQIQS